MGNMKSYDEIQAMLDKAIDMREMSSMSYKDGVRAALEWVLCQMDEGENPCD